MKNPFLRVNPIKTQKQLDDMKTQSSIQIREAALSQQIPYRAGWYDGDYAISYGFEKWTTPNGVSTRMVTHVTDSTLDKPTPRSEFVGMVEGFIEKVSATGRSVIEYEVTISYDGGMKKNKTITLENNRPLTLNTIVTPRESCTYDFYVGSDCVYSGVRDFSFIPTSTSSSIKARLYETVVRNTDSIFSVILNGKPATFPSKEAFIAGTSTEKYLPKGTSPCITDLPQESHIESALYVTKEFITYHKILLIDSDKQNVCWVAEGKNLFAFASVIPSNKGIIGYPNRYLPVLGSAIYDLRPITETSSKSVLVPSSPTATLSQIEPYLEKVQTVHVPVDASKYQLYTVKPTQAPFSVTARKQGYRNGETVVIDTVKSLVLCSHQEWIQQGNERLA